jgi:glutamate dehydrogenase/leucine dehydrogenase
LVADPAMPPGDKENVIPWFTHAIRDLPAYIPGPDMGTDERCMAWIHDELGRSVGLPEVLGGIPLDELGATGFGLAVAAEVAADALEVLSLAGARVAIQGFGADGAHVARFLAQRGAPIVAVSDRGGGLADPAGLPLDELVAWKASGHSVVGFGRGTVGPSEAPLAVECDILVPAARPDAITDANVEGIKARVVLEGANIPVTARAEAVLHERGVLCLPDRNVNAGGLICAAIEFDGRARTEAFDRIETQIRANTAAVLDRALGEARMPRAVAEEMALARVADATALRRRFPAPGLLRSGAWVSSCPRGSEGEGSGRGEDLTAVVAAVQS